MDNGRVAASVMETGLVEHPMADGFTFRPRAKVDWLLCDMVAQPAQIAALAGEWVASGRCRQAIFNFKLPMKKRLQALELCRMLIRQRLAGRGVDLRLKHLYHDRAEVTGFLRTACARPAFANRGWGGIMPSLQPPCRLALQAWSARPGRGYAKNRSLPEPVLRVAQQAESGVCS